MSEQGQARADGYRAFISYSHRDDSIAKTLHNRLETYRLPKKLIGQSGERGAISARLTPIFRDLDELSAADDLSVEIKAALARSATLIVLCSPGAKASKWVNLEIETFRALHGNTRPVLAALIEGEPADAFPPALTADGHEPVAADFRKGRDGKRLALLKLVAGMAGAPLDALVQRDAQRQYRRVMAITGGALAASLIMALLLVVALRSQAEAERQRQEAEGLVEYMLTDLRDKLKGVGRLDLHETVNERAMKYYNGQGDLKELPDNSLERRARVLLAMGEDYEKQGSLKRALQKFKEAHKTTAVLLAKAPDNADRVFAHAQGEYWVGYGAWQIKDRNTTERHWKGYLEQAKALGSIEPNSRRALLEVGYAHGNLCDLYRYKQYNMAAAKAACLESINMVEAAIKVEPTSVEARRTLANRYGWMANILLAEGDPSGALERRKAEQKILLELLNTDSKNIELQGRLLAAESSEAEILRQMERLDAARIAGERAVARARRMFSIAGATKVTVDSRLRALLILAMIERQSNRSTWVNYAAAARNDLDWMKVNTESRAMWIGYEQELDKF